MIIKPVPQLNGYFVSEYGDVFSTRRTPKMKKLPGTINGYGYRQYVLKIGDRKKGVRAHTLVLLAFAGPKPQGLECAHLDGNKLNNHYTNLKWATHQENVSHKAIHGTNLRGSKHHMAKLSETDIPAIHGLLANGVTCSKIGRLYGVSTLTIQYIKSRHNWSHVADTVDPSLYKDQAAKMKENVCPNCGKSYSTQAKLTFHLNKAKGDTGSCHYKLGSEEIKRLLESGMPQTQIAAKCGVHRATIRALKRQLFK